MNLFVELDPICLLSYDERVSIARMSIFPDPEDVLFCFYGG